MIFDRIRRVRRPRERGRSGVAELVPLDQLPSVNQRVSITYGDHVPVPSRVEDLDRDGIVIAQPSLALEAGDEVLITWECDGTWCSFATRVLDIDAVSIVPTIRLDTSGQLRVHDERRITGRREMSVPVYVRVVRSRAIRAGRELELHTTELGGDAVRFASSAAFAPGDVLELRLALQDGVDVYVGARAHVIRVDSVTGSWRSAITVAFDDILRSDRARIIAAMENLGRAAQASDDADGARAVAPTQDGVGGRDEPESISTLEAAVDWLRRRS